MILDTLTESKTCAEVFHMTGLERKTCYKNLAQLIKLGLVRKENYLYSCVPSSKQVKIII